MKVLVACEFSGTVRDAFTAAGHDAISCDLLPSEKPGKHYQGSILDMPFEEFDLMVAHPECTDLTASCVNLWPEKQADGRQQRAFNFVMQLAAFPVPRICIENPVGWLNSHWRKPDQIINPYQFGHYEQKKTCLWFKNLPCLVDTNNVKAATMLLPKNQRQRLGWLSPSVDRWKERSRTFPGIAAAMAGQWGTLPGLKDF